MHLMYGVPGSNVIELTLSTDHPTCSYGPGVLLFPDGRLIDASIFRMLRDLLGCSIETDNPEAVREALAVPEWEPGICLL